MVVWDDRLVSTVRNDEEIISLFKSLARQVYQSSGDIKVRRKMFLEKRFKVLHRHGLL